MKPAYLIAFPLLFFALLGGIYNNITAWQTVCNGQLSCDPGLQIISTNSPFFALLNGDFLSFLGGLLSPNVVGLGAVLSFISGAILLIFSFVGNISVGALTVNGAFGVTDQGSKTAQAVGVGLLVWSFATSLEGAWVGALPSNSGAILNAILEIFFIYGTWWQTQSRV